MTSTRRSAGAKYSKMSSQQATDGNNASESLMEDASQEMRIDRVRSCGDFIKWFMRDPCSRWPLVLFLIIGILCFLWIIISLIDAADSYVPAGVCGLIAAVFGAYHFKTLMALKGEVDDFERENVQFKRTNAELLQQVDKMGHAQLALTEQSSRLTESNKRMQDNLVRFKEFNSNLEVMGKNNVQGMSRISAMASKMEDKWRDQMIQSEKELYQKVYDKFELQDKDDGMTFNEYNDFVAHLPDKYRTGLTKQGSFQQLAGDDEKLDFEEFGSVLDKMAEDFAMGNTASSPRSNLIDDEQKD